MNASDLIIERVTNAGVFLAVHEMAIWGHNENAIASRCSDLSAEGKLVGRYRKGKHFKEWGLPEWIRPAVQYEIEPNGQMRMCVGEIR